MSLSKQSPTISDLPVDVISLVFEHLPLSEVLLKQSLVCKVFYQAHRQHCRSAVKRLTLLGHFMVNISRAKRSRLRNVVVQKETDRKLALFKIARSTGNSSCRVINSSTVHLKLVAGREEAAYEMIGEKFKSITHLEICQLPLERHHKQIVQMINAWNSEGGSNQLADFKIFFNKEIFDVKGFPLDWRHSNSHCCFAYIFGEGLVPSVAPALRRVTLVQANVKASRVYGCDYTEYRGPQIEKVNLSALESINSLDFSICKVLKGHYDPPWSRSFSSSSKLQDLTVDLRYCLYVEPTPSILKQLRSLTINLKSDKNTKRYELLAEAGVQLKSLTMKEVSVTLSFLTREFIAPFTTANASGVNHTLEHLRVDFEDRLIDPLKTSGLSLRPYVQSPFLPPRPPQPSLRGHFQALTSLHLVNTNFLHSIAGLNYLSELFPNLLHLRLDGNYDARCFREVITGQKAYNKPAKVLHDCGHCREHTRAVVVRRFGLNRAVHQFQFIDSSTAQICKEDFVRRAMAAWPQLTKISLQIEDFYEHALEKGVDLKYLFMSETIILRDAATGEAVPEAERVWTAEKVPY